MFELSELAAPQNDNDRLILRVMLVSGSLTGLAGLNCGWVGPLVPSIAVAQQMPLVEAGSIVSVYSAGSLIPLAVGKQLVEKLGGRKCLLMASLLFCIGLAILGCGHGVLELSIGAAALGIGAGLNSIAGTILILRLASTSGASDLSKLNVFYGVGALLGPQVAMVGLSSIWSYHAVYIFGAVFALCVMFGAGLSKKLDIRLPVTDTPDTGFNPRERAVLLYIASVFLYVGVEVAVAAWLFTYLNMTCRMPKEWASSSMTVMWCGLTLGRFLAIMLFKRYDSSKIVICAIALVTLSLITLCAFPALGNYSIIAVALLGFGFGPCFPTLIASASARYREHSAAITSTVITAGAFAGIAFPLAIGQVFSKIGHREGLSILVVCSALLMLLFYIVQFKMPREKKEVLGANLLTEV